MTNETNTVAERLAEISLPGEEWKPLPGDYEPYLISNLGRIVSARWHELRILKTQLYKVNARGKSYTYVRVALRRKDGNRSDCRPVYVARLVLEAFVGPPPNKWSVVRYADGDSMNVKLENLSWVQRSGLYVSPYSEEFIREIMLSPKIAKELAEDLNISKNTINAIRRGARAIAVPRPDISEDVLLQRKKAIRERIRKGAAKGGARGEDHYRSKLTEDDILKIRQRFATGEPGLTKKIANEYGLSTNAISHIKLGKRWKHVGAK